MIIGIEATHALKEKRTGVENYCFQVINELKKIIPVEVGVVLYYNNCCPERNEESSKYRDSHELLNNLPKNWSVKNLRWPFRFGWSQFRLSWELFFHPPDVFFAPGQLIPFYSVKNTITTIHDSAFKVFPSAYNFCGRQYLKVMNWLILKRSKIILTTSEFNKKELARLYSWFDVEKVKVLPLARVNENPQISSNDSKITKPYILSIGRLEEKKNTKRIIQAYNLLRSHSELGTQNCKLVLVGSPGVGYGEVKEEIEKSPFSADIILPGFMAGGELETLRRNAELFIFPSLYEGFGLPVLEAMASGCPVVIAGGGALEEVSGGAAELCDPYISADIARAMVAVLTDAPRRAKLIALGRARAQEFSWDKTARATWEIMHGM